MNCAHADDIRMPVYLSQDEALALLDICVMAAPESDAVSGAMLRLAHLCRVLMRQPAGAAVVSRAAAVEAERV